MTTNDSQHFTGMKVENAAVIVFDNQSLNALNKK